MKIDNHGNKLYTRDEMIELAQKFYKENGKLVIRNCKHKFGMPPIGQIIKEFDTFQKYILASGISIPDERQRFFNREELTDDELIKQFKNFVDEYIKINLLLPTSDDIDKCKYLQSSCVYFSRFKSMENIYSLIGINMKSFNNKRLEDDMICKYKEQCEKAGHVLNSREITKLSKGNNDCIYSTEAYLNHFGKLSDLQKLCGYIPTSLGKSITRDESLNVLKELSDEIDRVPTQNDVDLCEYCPSASYYFCEFGSFRSALKECGFYVGTRNLVTKNGIKCNSTYELKLAQVFESYNINFKKELFYRDFIKGFEKKYRFDFTLFVDNNIYHVELFGIIGSEDYVNKTREKIDLCKNNNLYLIDLYQKDIYAKLNSEIYQYIMDRINNKDFAK